MYRIPAPLLSPANWVGLAPLQEGTVLYTHLEWGQDVVWGSSCQRQGSSTKGSLRKLGGSFPQDSMEDSLARFSSCRTSELILFSVSPGMGDGIRSLSHPCVLDYVICLASLRRRAGLGVTMSEACLSPL